VGVDNTVFTHLISKEQDSLILLWYDNSLKLVFTQKHPPDFWLHTYSEYPELSDKVVKYLMPFPTTYVSESAFSVLAALTSKYQNKLDVEPTRFKLENYHHLNWQPISESCKTVPAISLSD
jgi:hypothetical protein